MQGRAERRGARTAAFERRDLCRKLAPEPLLRWFSGRLAQYTCGSTRFQAILTAGLDQDTARC